MMCIYILEPYLIGSCLKDTSFTSYERNIYYCYIISNALLLSRKWSAGMALMIVSDWKMFQISKFCHLPPISFIHIIIIIIIVIHRYEGLDDIVKLTVLLPSLSLQVWCVQCPLPRRMSWSWRVTTLSWCQTRVRLSTCFLKAFYIVK